MAKTILLIMLLSLAMSKDIHLDYGVDKNFLKVIIVLNLHTLERKMNYLFI